jgi:ribosome modulation factor
MAKQKRARVLVTKRQYLKAAIGDFTEVSCPFASATQRRAAKAGKRKAGRKK